MKKIILTTVILLCLSQIGVGQMNIDILSTIYSQDFNTLTNGTWANNTTLSGWYAKTDATANITTYGANTGSNTAGGLYAFGVLGTNPLAERALGFSPSNAYTGGSGTGKGYLGWRLKNNTGGTITSLTVIWTGEQWRKDNTAVQNLKLFYQTATTVTDLTGGTWTDASSLFNSKINTTGGAIDGNAFANKTDNITAVISISIPSGNEIMLRWEDLNDTGLDHLLAIDDVAISATGAVATPPPALSADVTQNDVDHPLDITFTDDATWRFAVSAVKVNNTALTPVTDYDLTSGNLQLKPAGGNSLLTSSGTKTVTVEATGYNAASVSQVINPGVPTANSTATINNALAPGVTRTIAIIARDQYSNLVPGYFFKYDATITNNDAATAESYTIDGTPTTTTVTGISVITATSALGVATLPVIMPAAIDINDGISIQIKLDNGTTPVSAAFGYSNLPPVIILTAADAGTGSFPAGSNNNILYRIKVDATNTATLNQVQVSLSGNYTSGDITGFNLRYSTDVILIPANDPIIGSASSLSTGTGETIIFSGLTQSIPLTGAYIFVTADITASGTPEHTISGGCSQNTDFTFAAPSSFGTGSFSAPNTHSIVAVPLPGEILINHFNPGYSGASDEYVELLNTTGKTFDLGLLKLDYLSAGGGTGTAGGPLSGIIGPYQYWLLSTNASITAGGTTSLLRDGSMLSGFSGSAGQLALIVQSTSTVLDGVAYGNVTVNNYGEGTPASAPSSNGGLIRSPEGTDSNNNSTDFVQVSLATIYLHNHHSLHITEDYTIPAADDYHDITIAGNDPVVLMDGNVTVNKKLKIQSGSLQIGNVQHLTVHSTTTLNDPECLIIKSDAAGTGSFIDNGNILGTGTARIERYLTTGVWHHISSPVINATANDFLGDYLKTSDPAAAEGWAPYISDPAAILEPGRGYACWKPATNPGLEYFSGVPYSGDITILRDNVVTDPYAGWHLVGNPYPSSIDLASPGILWNNFDDVAYFWNQSGTNPDYPEGGNYDAFPAESGFGTHSQYAPPMQSFFLQVTTVGGTSLSIQTAARVHDNSPFLKSANEISNALLLSVSSSANNYYDRLTVYFKADATSGYDQGYDAKKLRGLNEAPQLYTKIGDQDVTCNSLPFESKTTVVPMGFSCGIPGTFTIKADSLTTFAGSIAITLEDKKLNVLNDLKLNPEYTFEYQVNDNADRFLLHFFNPTIGIEEKINDKAISIYSYENSLYLKSNDGKPIYGNLLMFDMTGRKVFEKSLSGQTNISINPDVATGYYIVSITTSENSFKEKILIR